jgi:hypothetical protein
MGLARLTVAVPLRAQGSLRAKRTRWKIQFQPGSPDQCDRRYPSAVEIPVSLVGRKDLTGEIYRQLRRPRTAAAGGRPQAGLEVRRESCNDMGPCS